MVWLPAVSVAVMKENELFPPPPVNVAVPMFLPLSKTVLVPVGNTVESVGRHRRDDDVETNRLADCARIRRRYTQGRRIVFIDSLRQRTAAAAAEIGVARIDCGDGVAANAQCPRRKDGKGSAAFCSERAGSDLVAAIKESHGTGRWLGARCCGQDSGVERDALARGAWIWPNI